MAIVLVTMFLAACEERTGPPEGGTVVLRFDHRLDGVPLELGVTRGSDGAGNEFTVDDLRFLLSEVIIRPPDPGKHGIGCESQGPFLVEGDTPPPFALECVAGNYALLQFDLGLRPDRNVPEEVPDTPAFDDMKWPQQLGGGHAFIHIEGEVHTAQGSNHFLLRIGELDDLVEISCLHPVDLHLFDITQEYVVTIDWARAFKEIHAIDLTQLPPSIEGDRELQSHFRENLTKTIVPQP